MDACSELGSASRGAAPQASLAGLPTVPSTGQQEDGKYLDAEGDPTYNIAADGKVDWYTFSGYRRYHSECHVCHGPDGAGSTYAPALADLFKHMTYTEFSAPSRRAARTCRPAAEGHAGFGENKNVMCYLDDIYVYLRARADGALGRVRPENHEESRRPTPRPRERLAWAK